MTTKFDPETDPIERFQELYDRARQVEPSPAEAAALATVSRDGRPSARIILFKGLEERCPTFFTNYGSRKAMDIAVNPFVALTFYWPKSYVQVRFEGRVEKLSRKQSEEYFASRAFESQVSAHVSPQSREISSWDGLQAELNRKLEEFRGRSPRCPEHWGGYRLVPDVIEFWIGQEFRLHQRYRFQREHPGMTGHGAWRFCILAP